MRVAAGREVSVNGRRYLAGDELPAMDAGVVEQLRRSGVVEIQAEAQDEVAREEVDERPARGRRA